MKWSPAKRTLDAAERQYAQKWLWARHFAPTALSHTAAHRRTSDRSATETPTATNLPIGHNLAHSKFNRASFLHGAPSEF